MVLTRKDAQAGVLVALSVIVLAIAYAGWGVPLIGSSTRWAAALVLVLGLGAYLSGSPLQGSREPVLGVLGIVATALAIIALATGSMVFLGLLVADIVVLFAATTRRHGRLGARGPMAAGR